MKPFIHASQKTSSCRRGVLAVFFALCLTLVFGMILFSVEQGFLFLTQRELQTAADAASLAAARYLADGRTTVTSVAKTWALRNVAAKSSVVVFDGDVELGRWDSSTATFTVILNSSKEVPNAVRVTCGRTKSRGNALKLLISGMFGRSFADVSASAIARLKTSRCGLIIGTDGVNLSSGSYVDSYNAENGYNPSEHGMYGHVCSNQDIVLSGSSAIYGNAHPGAGYSVYSSSSIGPLRSTDSLTMPLAFPPIDLGNAATINDNRTIPLSAKGKNPINAKGELILHGGDSLTLNPGVYYVRGVTLTGGSELFIKDKTTIYVDGDIDMTGGGMSNQTKLPKNLLLYVLGSSCKLSGGMESHAVVYAPTSDVSRSGDSAYFGAIFSKSLDLNGNGGIHADESLDKAVLGGSATRTVLCK